MKAYKLLKRKHGKLFSAINHPTGWRVNYRVHKINRPRKKNSKLFVFKRLKDATTYKMFWGNKPYHEIWEIEVPDLRPRKYVAAKQYDLFWRTGTSPDRISVPNTFVCDSLKLVRRIPT